MGHTEPKWPTRWSAVNLPNWLLHLYLADLLVLLLLEVVVEVEVVEEEVLYVFHKSNSNLINVVMDYQMPGDCRALKNKFIIFGQLNQNVSLAPLLVPCAPPPH